MSIEVGDRVVFVTEGFPVTGKRGIVEGARPFALLVLFDDGSVGTWRRDDFRKVAPEGDGHERE